MPKSTELSTWAIRERKNAEKNQILAVDVKFVLFVGTCTWMNNKTRDGTHLSEIVSKMA